jgi:hypothetical protein
MAKTAFNKKLNLNVRKKAVKCYIWSTALYGAETSDVSENRSKVPGKF